jgi:hypothetical protein
LPAGLPGGISAIAHQSLGAAYAVAGGVAAAGAVLAVLFLAVLFLPAQPASQAVTVSSETSVPARSPAEESARS